MKTEKCQCSDRQKGSAAIEAILSFVGFLFVIFTILNIVNFCRAQTLISNAVDTAAKEMSQYSYFYEISGLQKFSNELSSRADGGASTLNEVVNNVDNLYQSVTGAVDNTIDRTTEITNAIESGSGDIETIKGQLSSIQTDVQSVETALNLMDASIEGIMSNPVLYLKSIVAVAGNEGLDLLKSHAIAAPLAKALTAKHFGSTTSEASEYLEALGVVGGLEEMNFKMSTIFASETPNEIHIVVYYKLKINQILEWAQLEAVICKEAVAVAWLGGDNVTERIEPIVSASTDSEDVEQSDENANDENSSEDDTGTTGLWALPTRSDDGYFLVQSPAFADLLGDTYGFSANGNVTDLCGQTGTTAYGCINLVDGDGLITGLDEQKSILAERAYLSSVRALKDYEEVYNPDIAKSSFNYKPGDITNIEYIVYVPENIPDETLNDIKAISELGAADYKKTATEELGRDITVSVSFVKAGGNYDYGGNDQ